VLETIDSDVIKAHVELGFDVGDLFPAHTTRIG
jgi:hypothetical protein